MQGKTKNESTFPSDLRGRQWDNEFEGVSLKIRLLVQTPSGTILGSETQKRLTTGKWGFSFSSEPKQKTFTCFLGGVDS